MKKGILPLKKTLGFSHASRTTIAGKRWKSLRMKLPRMPSWWNQPLSRSGFQPAQFVGTCWIGSWQKVTLKNRFFGEELGVFFFFLVGVSKRGGRCQCCHLPPKEKAGVAFGLCVLLVVIFFVMCCTIELHHERLFLSSWKRRIGWIWLDREGAPPFDRGPMVFMFGT